MTRISDRTLIAAGSIAFAVITVATALLSPAMVAKFYPLPADQGAAWYYWQLPVTSALARTTYWLGYGLHQIVIWVLLFRAKAAADYQKNRTDALEGRGRPVSRFNVIVLAVNVAFVALHLVQTYFWYDGLAQDVPIWTSQGSVIVMLVVLLYLEAPHRGLVWGRKFQPSERFFGVVMKFHGIYIAWAITYTFWFHPMDGNWGLLSGFVYMFLLFIQLSMFNTRLHMNRKWVVLLEAFVAVHGTLITVYKNNPIWPMFMIGFLVMLVLTQMHEFGWARRFRWVLLTGFVVGVVALYVFVRGIDQIYEITFIPVALYGGALALVFIGWLAERIVVVHGASKA